MSHPTNQERIGPEFPVRVAFAPSSVGPSQERPQEEGYRRHLHDGADVFPTVRTVSTEMACGTDGT
jgi:hypothetical protein